MVVFYKSDDPDLLSSISSSFLDVNMVKIGIAVVVGLIGISLAYPVVEEAATPAVTNDTRVTARQGGFGAVLGAIGTALVPVVGAVLGPILTNLANGIATAFNNGLNVSTNRTEAQALLVRIPQDSPLYAALVQGQLITPDVQDGLPAVGPSSATPTGKTPYAQPGKLSGKFGAFLQAEPAPADDVEPILTHDADVPEPPVSSAVKRVPQRKRPEIDYV